MEYPGIRTWAAGVGMTLALCLTLAPPAAAKHWQRGHDESRWGGASYGYRRAPVRYVVVRRSRVIMARPAYARYFVVRRPRFVVVRPVPYWPVEQSGVAARVGIRTRGVNVNFSLRSQGPLYGCDFCDDYFSSYSSWERHVTGCHHRPAERVIAEPWDRGDIDQFRYSASEACRRCGDESCSDGYGDDSGGYSEDPGDYGDDDGYYREDGDRRWRDN